MHRDIRALRGEVQELITDEEKSLRRDPKALRDEITSQRVELDSLRGGGADVLPPAGSASRRPGKSR
ncbi:hypothetical protein BURK2_00591 [Burkholderiales bacterium]|nr:MAG: hypothetical protein F9K47_17765 [Burkholderiales bacterium]CAG0958287.1 hypothetical protein BURK2_00591 [Burkholderiales bacterium]